MTDRVERGTPFSVREFLRERQALLVHFNTPQSRHDKGFPDDLRRAMNLKGTPLCFSTIQIGDRGPGQVIGNWREANAGGSVGIVVDITEASVVAVGPGDDGSDTRGASISTSGKDPTPETCANSIDKRIDPEGRKEDGVNEWLVKDYVTLGVFVFPNPHVWMAGRGDRPTSCAELLQTFECERLFRVSTEAFIELDRRSGTWLPVTYDQIVRPQSRLG